MKQIDKTHHVVFADVFGEKASIPVSIRIISEGSGRDGLMLEFNEQEYEDFRVVVENQGGMLVCHVWATKDSAGSDPTHSIKIEAKK